MVAINSVVEPTRISSLGVEWKTTRKTWQNGRTTSKRLWATPLHTFEVEWEGINESQYSALKAFFNDQYGEWGVFDLIDTHTNTTYQVSFDDDTLKRENIRPNVRGLYRIRLKFQEDKP